MKVGSKVRFQDNSKRGKPITKKVFMSGHVREIQTWENPYGEVVQATIVEIEKDESTHPMEWDCTIRLENGREICTSLDLLY